MNKFHVLALGVLIGLFSACSDDLYRPDASIAEGQAYFEENAVDLAPMHFPREPWIQLSRSAAEAIPELTPMWEQALSSSGEAESIVEVPVYSRSKPFCTEEIIQDGENLGKQITPGFRRLLVTTNEDGSKEMLLLTIVPDKEYSGDLEENPENFCYLGGGDFSGKVFCSNLDGEYLYAWEYKNGVRQKLRTVNGFNLTVALWDDKPASYTVIRINEASPTSANTYSYDETGGDIWWAGGGEGTDGGGAGSGGGSGSGGGGGGSYGGGGGGYIEGGYSEEDLRLGEIGRQQILTDLANDNVTTVKVRPDAKSEAGAVLDVFSLGVNKYSIIASISTFLEKVPTKALANFGNSLGLIGGILGSCQTYIAFSDGDISPNDMVGAVSTALNWIGLACAFFITPYVGAIIGGVAAVIGLVSTVYGMISQSILLQVTTKNGKNVYIYIPGNQHAYA